MHKGDDSSEQALNLVVPIFPVSSCTGAQLPTLHAFLARLSPTAARNADESVVAMSHGGEDESLAVQQDDSSDGGEAGKHVANHCHFSSDHPLLVRETSVTCTVLKLPQFPMEGFWSFSGFRVQLNLKDLLRAPVTIFALRAKACSCVCRRSIPSCRASLIEWLYALDNTPSADHKPAMSSFKWAQPCICRVSIALTSS